MDLGVGPDEGFGGFFIVVDESINVALEFFEVLPQVLLRKRLQRQHPRMQKVWAGPAIHSSFEGLEAVDLSFRLAIAPPLADRVSHGIHIPVQGAGEPLHSVKAGLLRAFQPGGEFTGVLAS